MEVFAEDTSTFCLDLEDNINDDDYRFANNTVSILNIEQFTTLTDAQPGGAGNTGGILVDMGVGFSDPTNQNDGFCGF